MSVRSESTREQRPLMANKEIILTAFEGDEKSGINPKKKIETDLESNTKSPATVAEESKCSNGFHCSSLGAHTVLFTAVAMVVCFSVYSWSLHKKTAGELESLKIEVNRLTNFCRGQRVEGRDYATLPSFSYGNVERMTSDSFASAPDMHLRELVVKAMDGARDDLHIPRHRVNRAAPDDDRVRQEKPTAADGSDSSRKVKRKCWKRGKMAGNQKCRGKRTHRKGRRLRGKATRKHGKSSTADKVSRDCGRENLHYRNIMYQFNRLLKMAQENKLLPETKKQFARLNLAINYAHMNASDGCKGSDISWMSSNAHEEPTSPQAHRHKKLPRQVSKAVHFTFKQNSSAIPHRESVVRLDASSLMLSQPADWMDSMYTRLSEEPIQINGSGYRVTETCLYFVYSSVTFSGVRRDVSQSVEVNGHRILRCVGVVSHSKQLPGNKREVTCAMSGVTYLAAGDYLEMKTNHTDTEIDVVEDVTYFGAFQLRFLGNAGSEDEAGVKSAQ